MTDRNAWNPLRGAVLGLAIAGGGAALVGLNYSSTRPASAAPAAPVASASPAAPAASPAAARLTPVAATPAIPATPATPATPPPALPASSELGEEPGVTKPSDEGNLAFAGPGVIAKVLVKPGDTVKAGDVLALQDDRAEKAQLAAAVQEAKTLDTQIEANKAELALKQVMQKRSESLYADLLAQGKSNTEVDQARADAKIADIQIKFTEEQKKQKEMAVAAQQVKVDEKKLVSPIDGVIANIDVHAGEGVDLSKAAMMVVKNDPLWVEVDIPSGKAKMLSVNQTLEVRYQDEDKWMQGQIIFLTPYADAGSNTRKVRIQMPNPKHREAGLPVVVRLPENVASVK